MGPWGHSSRGSWSSPGAIIPPKTGGKFDIELNNPRLQPRLPSAWQTEQALTEQQPQKADVMEIHIS